MATYTDTYNRMRWFAERNRLALVLVNERKTSIEDLYQNIPTGSKVRIYGSKIAQHFDEDNNVLTELPEQFHEAIVYKAIASGYEIPPTQNFQAAQYFNAAYAELVKQASKWKKMGRVTGVKHIKQIDF